jgi:hypothetical protein
LPDLQQSQPDTVRTLLQLLDANFAKLTEATVWLKRDAGWGKKLKGAAVPTTTTSTNLQFYLPGLDDARLFLHNSNIYVSYREGPGFGYESQVFNPIHFKYQLDKDNNDPRINNNNNFAATIFASETASFCCGRNMALMQDFATTTTAGKNTKNEQNLYSLTWVDPVTVEKVDTTPLNQQQRQQQNQRANNPKHNMRRLTVADTTSTVDTAIDDFPLVESQQHRRLKSEKHKSHIHGTNAFMVPLPNSSTLKNQPIEFLGVAHFHRPNDRKPNPYARFGHHYTHAFYTVAACRCSRL